MTNVCYISEEPCEYCEDGECIAVFIEQCPLNDAEDREAIRQSQERILTNEEQPKCK